MFELRDTIRRLDDETDYRYDLTGMYEATELSEPEKKLIAAMIADAKDPEEIAGELFKIFNTQNAMNMDEDCDSTLTEDVKEEIQDGDEIVYNGEHLFVTNADYMDLGKWLWVTDKEEDRYNKKASGWSLAKELVDEVIGQPDEEELDESLKDFMFTVKCNDGPKEVIRVVAEDRSKAEEYAKKMYAQNHTTYADDRHNIWSIEDKSDLHEALHGMNEIEQFVKMANQIGLKTMGDVKNFLDREGDGKDILTALYDYLYNEIGDLEFQAKDESLKESDNSQFDKAVEAMKAYWNYQMSLEQLHNTLLKIYNNDAEKAFKVFVEYGDAARRAKDECLNCDPKKENVPTVKEETLKEDNDAEEWEEVASKAVEDSDGFLTDYVWYTDGNKHVFVFGDSDIYRPEDGDFDWEVDIVEGKEAEAYKEAQDWFDSYNGFADENLNEANYGGAFDIHPDQYFTRDDINDAAEKVAEEINNKVSFTDKVSPEFEVAESWFEDNNFTVRVVDKFDSSEYENSIHIDMRRIKRPNDLADKYSSDLAQKLVDQITYSKTVDEAQDVYDIQGQAVRDSKRKEVLDEFKDIFGTGDNGEVNIDSEETLGYVRSFLEDQGYSVLVSDSTNAEHPIHIEWFK